MAKLPGKILRYPIVDSLGDDKESIPTQRAFSVGLPGKALKTTKINNKPLTGNVVILPSELGLYSKEDFKKKSDLKLDRTALKGVAGQSKTDGITQRFLTEQLKSLETKTGPLITQLNESINKSDASSKKVNEDKINSDSVYDIPTMDSTFATDVDINRGPVKEWEQLNEVSPGTYQLEDKSELNGRMVWIKPEKWMNPNMFMTCTLANDPSNSVVVHVQLEDGDSDQVDPIVLKLSADKKSLTSVKNSIIWVSIN